MPIFSLLFCAERAVTLSSPRSFPTSVFFRRFSLEVPMRTDIAEPVRLKDYRVPDYLIDKVDLDVKLHPAATRVLARLHIRPNPQGRSKAPLILDGDGLTAVKIALDGQLLDLHE